MSAPGLDQDLDQDIEHARDASDAAARPSDSVENRVEEPPALVEEAAYGALEEEGAVYDSGDSDIPCGPVVIQNHLKNLPDRPGVYRMLAADGSVLYVGKARSLKRRVASYATLAGHTTRILRMIMATASMVFVTTETETEALLLESNLIKQLKPRFNVLLRDDKSFPHILIRDGAFPMLTKHRGAKSDKGRYFGPFASAGAVNRTLNQLQKAFLLRNCSDSMFENRTRPCLQYQIKRCAAPCVGLISEEDYAALVDDAARFLTGRSTKVQEELAARMQEASAAMEFERAAAIRDRIRALTQIQSHQGVNPSSVEEADVIALHSDQGQTCIQVFFFRSGQNWGNRAYFPRAMRDCSDVEILEAFLGQFYSTKAPPRQLIVSHELEQGDLIAEALTTVAGRKVEIVVPKRGEKRTLVDHALSNARESLGRKVAENAAQGKLLAGLAEAFDLPRPPRRIEVYDNSHIQGAHAVGGMIVAGADGYLKSQYRKFNIKAAEVAGDDFGMMREVMTRRFSRLLKEDPERAGSADDESAPQWPDVVLIDGGAGQLSATAEVFRELGIEVDGENGPALIAVAKGEERDAGKEVFHRLGKPPKALPFRDPTLYFLQRLRDEAHRWAIGAHRQKRAKAAGATPLDEVPGVGAARKRALLAHFGSAKAVSRAGLADLEKVDGVSRALAKRVYDFFHGGGEA